MKQNIVGFLKILGISFGFALLFVTFLSAVLLPYSMWKDPDTDIRLLFSIFVVVGLLLQFGVTAEYLYRSRNLNGDPNRFRRHKFWMSRNKLTVPLKSFKEALEKVGFINVVITDHLITATNPVVLLGVPTRYKAVDFIRPRTIAIQVGADEKLLLTIKMPRTTELFDFSMSSFYLYDKLNSDPLFRNLQFDSVEEIASLK